MSACWNTYEHALWCAGGYELNGGELFFNDRKCDCKPYVQLEFDLWVEERFSQVEMIHAETRWSRVNYLKNTHREVEFYESPTSMHTIVRYRV